MAKEVAVTARDWGSTYLRTGKYADLTLREIYRLNPDYLRWVVKYKRHRSWRVVSAFLREEKGKELRAAGDQEVERTKGKEHRQYESRPIPTKGELWRGSGK